MVSTSKRGQSNKSLHSQLDDFDQDMIIGNAASERQENTVVNEGTNDWDFFVDTSNGSSIVNGNAMNVETLERCFKERIDRQMSNIVDTVEDGIRNAILTAFENMVAPKIELAIRSINASSGRDATSVFANSERREHVGISTSCENASGNNDTLGVSNVNDETRQNIPDEVSELLVSETRFDRQPHTYHMVTGPSNPNHHMVTGPSNPNHHMVTGLSNPNHHMVTGPSNPNHHMVTGPSNPNHHMVTGQTAQTNQFPEFLTGRILTPRNPPSHQY